MGVRIVSGIILGALAIVVIAHGGVIFFFVATLLAMLGLNEFYRITRRYRPIGLGGFVGLLLLCWAAWFKTPPYVFATIALAVLLIALLGMAAGPKPGVTARMAVTLLGLLYIGLGIGHMMLYEGDHAECRKFESAANPFEVQAAAFLAALSGAPVVHSP